MTEAETINRKILLRTQAIRGIRSEAKKLRLQRSLLEIRAFLEKQIEHAENQKQLSQHLDMTETLFRGLEVY